MGLTLLIGEDSNVWGWVPSVTRWELSSTAARNLITRSIPRTFWFWRFSLLRQSLLTGRTNDDSLSLTRPKLPLVHDRVEAQSRLNIVPEASHVGLLLRTLR